jgi:carbon monoxide dehydrogenase subunit G
MHLDGETRIAAPRQRVWEALSDPHRVAGCAPGDPQVEVVDERKFRVSAVVGNLFFRSPVTIEIELYDVVPPSSATGRASGVVMGGPVSAVGAIRLEELDQSSTKVDWEADIELGGMLAGFAGMAVQPAREAIDGTLDCLRRSLESEAEAGQHAPGQP